MKITSPEEKDSSSEVSKKTPQLLLVKGAYISIHPKTIISFVLCKSWTDLTLI